MAASNPWLEFATMCKEAGEAIEEAEMQGMFIYVEQKRGAAVPERMMAELGRLTRDRDAKVKRLRERLCR